MLAEKMDSDIIPSSIPRVPCMKRLMEVTYKVNEEL